MYLPRAISLASFTRFNGACQFFTAPYLHDNELPTFIQNFLDLGRNVDYLTRRNNFIVAMYIAIKQFLIPEGILDLPVLVEVLYIISMCDMAFSS